MATVKMAIVGGLLTVAGVIVAVLLTPVIWVTTIKRGL